MISDTIQISTHLNCVSLLRPTIQVVEITLKIV